MFGTNVLVRFLTVLVNAMQENMSADVRGATCRIAIREADDFTFTRVKFPLRHMQQRI